MKRILIVAGLSASLMSATAAEAAGCLKGAAVGGVAGHFAGHHPVLGALAGCAIGRHSAKARRQDEQQRQQGQFNPDDETNTRM